VPFRGHFFLFGGYSVVLTLVVDITAPGPTGSGNPPTGDINNLPWWVMLGAFILLGLSVCVTSLVKKRRQ
jgi:hypothetical protein